MFLSRTENKKYHTTRGVTLIETLVYIAVMLVLSGALFLTFFSLDTVLVRNKVERELTDSASVSLERMSRAIRSAGSVNTGLSTLGSSPGALAVQEGTTTTRFYISGNNLMMSVNGVVLGPLTADGVTVESLVFTRYVGVSSEMVRVALTLSSDNPAASSTRTFYTSAVLRGSYE